MRVLIAGASGFIGRALARRLADGGHDVLAAARRGGPQLPGVHPIALDVGDADAALDALQGVEAAYYLVHSMGSGKDFAERDRALAENFATAAAAAGVKRIVYLGGLGTGDELSDHLRSRQEVGRVLASTGLDVVELRAAVILGAGSISFEMMRYLVERLPAMVCPRWVKTPIEPIAAEDVIDYLEESLEVAPGIYGIGGESTTYKDLMQIYAQVRGLRKRLILDVPLLTLHLSSYWVDFVTPVDRKVSHSLIASLSVPVTVPDRPHTDAAFRTRPRSVHEALTGALDRQIAEIDDGITERAAGQADGVHVMRDHRTVPDAQAEAIAWDLQNCGGDLNWYGIPNSWRMRMLIGRLLGEDFTLERPETLQAGERVDWWRIVRCDSYSLVLRADGWKPGEGWLAFKVEQEPSPALIISAALRPRGILGLAYWRLLQPIHLWAFNRMTTHRVHRGIKLQAEAASAGSDD